MEESSPWYLRCGPRTACDSRAVRAARGTGDARDEGVLVARRGLVREGGDGLDLGAEVVHVFKGLLETACLRVGAIRAVSRAGRARRVGPCTPAPGSLQTRIFPAPSPTPRALFASKVRRASRYPGRGAAGGGRRGKKKRNGGEQKILHFFQTPHQWKACPKQRTPRKGGAHSPSRRSARPVQGPRRYVLQLECPSLVGCASHAHVQSRSLAYAGADGLGGCPNACGQGGSRRPPAPGGCSSSADERKCGCAGNRHDPRGRGAANSIRPASASAPSARV